MADTNFTTIDQLKVDGKVYDLKDSISGYITGNSPTINSPTINNATLTGSITAP